MELSVLEGETRERQLWGLKATKQVPLLVILITGVKASQKIAEVDLKAMDRYKTIIKRVGEKLCVEPALIAAIISRESHAGKVLQNGWGDNGNGFGLMQVFADPPLEPALFNQSPEIKVSLLNTGSTAAGKFLLFVVLILPG